MSSKALLEVVNKAAALVGDRFAAAVDDPSAQERYIVKISSRMDDA